MRSHFCHNHIVGQQEAVVTHETYEFQLKSREFVGLLNLNHNRGNQQLVKRMTVCRLCH